MPLFVSGTYKTVTDRVIRLSEIAEGHTIMEANANTGKIVLKVRDEDDGSQKDEL